NAHFTVAPAVANPPRPLCVPPRGSGTILCSHAALHRTRVMTYLLTDLCEFSQERTSSSVMHFSFSRNIPRSLRMGRVRYREFQLVVFLLCVTRAHVSPLGRVFLLDLENYSKAGPKDGFEAAEQACLDQGARVASGADLHHAVLECAFSSCSRGWLSGPSIGTTVCSGVPGSLRPFDVQLENSTANGERLGVFCVKDSDAPCGQPPSFLNSHLQGKTGLDLGDEVLYACDAGHKLPNGETAFSLLCDSCGEWYGHVQHCIKDDPEGHVDYEDTFTDGHLLQNSKEEHHTSLTTRGTQSTHSIEEEFTPEPVHEQAVISGEENEKESLVPATVPPVSQLSQKHMFWFPSEAFQEEKGHLGVPEDSVKHPSEEESQITAKTDENLSNSDQTTEEHDHPTDPPIDEPPSHSTGGTDDSWLDGYPVTQEEDKTGGESTGEVEAEQEEERESVTGLSEMEGFENASEIPVEEETGVLIDRSNNEEPKDTDHPKGKEEEFGKDSTKNEKELSVVKQMETTEDEIEDERPEQTDHDGSETLVADGVTDAPNGLGGKPTSIITTPNTAKPDDSSQNKRPMIYTPASAPENVSTSQGGLGLENTSTPSGLAHLEDASEEITTITTPFIKDPWETIDHHLLEHIPNHVPTKIPENQSKMEHQEKESGEICLKDPCNGSGHGPMIAAIIIGLVAAVVGAVLGVWCYKRRQQKSSQYQLNGTNTQTQCIELQQTV
ncbi:hypothetical protein DNTS_004442, partial [Danionella cerebrum]